MARMRCSTCNGEYDTVQTDGTRYFHACAPLRRLRVRRLDGTIVDLVIGTELPTDVVLGEVAIARPNARDENVVPVTGSVGVPKAEGAGAVRIG